MHWQAKLSAARIVLKREAPWISIALYGMIVREVPGLGTFGVTEDWILMVDPEVVEKWTLKQIVGVLYHEVLHLLRDHSTRCKKLRIAPGCENEAFKRRIWNIAADCENNDDLTGFELPEGGWFPTMIGMDDGLPAEAYYKNLVDEIEQMPQMAAVCALKHDGSGGEDSEDSESDGESGSGNGGKDEEEEEEEEEDEKNEDDSDGGGKDEEDEESDGGAGSGSDDKDGENETEAGGGGQKDSKQAGDPQKGFGRSPCGSGAGAPAPNEPKAEGRSKAETKQLKEATARAVKACASRGKVPGSLKRWAEEILGPPQIPWEEQLARACIQAVDLKSGDEDSAYDRPHRWQQAYNGDDAPLLARPFSPVPDVMLAVDTSGSMGTEELTASLTEAQGIFEMSDTEPMMVAFDAKVQQMEEVGSVEAARNALVGGGGTSFVPLFEMLEEKQLMPSILVIFTDGIAPAPEAPPPLTEVIWVLVGRHKRRPWVENKGSYGSSANTITWGTFVEIPEFERKAA